MQTDKETLETRNTNLSPHWKDQWRLSEKKERAKDPYGGRTQVISPLERESCPTRSRKYQEQV